MRSAVRLIVVAAVLVFAGCGGTTTPTARSTPSPTPPAASPSPAAPPSPSSSPGAPTARILVQGGKIVGGAKTIEVRIASKVTLEIVSDARDEVHVHGYDKLVGLAPGMLAKITFVANIPGTFEVELERAKIQLCKLRVR